MKTQGRPQERGKMRKKKKQEDKNIQSSEIHFSMGNCRALATCGVYFLVALADRKGGTGGGFIDSVSPVPSLRLVNDSSNTSHPVTALIFLFQRELPVRELKMEFQSNTYTFLLPFNKRLTRVHRFYLPLSRRIFTFWRKRRVETVHTDKRIIPWTILSKSRFRLRSVLLINYLQYLKL